MTPQEIQEKHFHDTFRGYSHEEVDLFLDEVAVAFERLYRENQSFMRRVVDLEEQLKRAQETASAQPRRAHETSEEDTSATESTLKRMLLIAQETADRAIAEARQRAREIQEQARARADEMMEHAERRVRELSAERMEKEKELDRAKEALRRFDQQYRASFRVFIESQLEALKDLPATPPASDTEIAAGPPPVFGEHPEALGTGEAAVAPPSIGMETMSMETQPPAQETPSDIALQEGHIEEIDVAAAPADSGTDSGPKAETDTGEWRDDAHPHGVETEADSELVRTPRGNVPPQRQEAPGPLPQDTDPRSRHSPRAAQGRTRKDKRNELEAQPDGNDAEEDRLIRELFWGDED